MAFNRSAPTGAIALDISKTFDRVLHAGLLYKLKSSGISDGLELFWRGILHKNIQLMLEFLKAPFLFLHYTLMTFLMMLSVILLSIYADDTLQILNSLVDKFY